MRFTLINEPRSLIEFLLFLINAVGVIVERNTVAEVGYRLLRNSHIAQYINEKGPLKYSNGVCACLQRGFPRHSGTFLDRNMSL